MISNIANYQKTGIIFFLNLFQFNLKVENLKMMTGDYDVVISAKNLAQFTSHSRPIVYYIAVEPDSSFE